MKKTYLLIGIIGFLLSSKGAHAIIDATIEAQYFGGTVSGPAANGVPINPKFSGYLIKPAIHLNYTLAGITFGAGPTLSVPSITNRDLPATTISDSVTMLRYGGEAYARVQLHRWLQPFIRFEIGKDNIKETNSGYPTITSGPGTGTVLTGQVAEVRFSYGSLYYVIGGGFQANILPYLDLFVFAGYSAGSTSTPDVQSFTVNGVPITNYTVTGSVSYSGIQTGGGLMLRF